MHMEFLSISSAQNITLLRYYVKNIYLMGIIHTVHITGDRVETFRILAA